MDSGFRQEWTRTYLEEEEERMVSIQEPHGKGSAPFNCAGVHLSQLVHHPADLMLHGLAIFDRILFTPVKSSAYCTVGCRLCPSFRFVPCFMGVECLG